MGADQLGAGFFDTYLLTKIYGEFVRGCSGLRKVFDFDYFPQPDIYLKKVIISYCHKRIIWHDRNMEQIADNYYGVNWQRFEEMYDQFDSGHNREHMRKVRNGSISLASKYLPNKLGLAYAAATLHDIGLSVSRENHEEDGAELVLNDEELKNRIPAKELEEIADAIREHRASTGNPQTILAKIISDADRSCDSKGEPLIRAYHYGLKHFPDLSDDEQVLRAADHMVEKFSPGRFGRRTYFPETDVKMEETYGPIIEAAKRRGVEELRQIMNS